MKNLIKKFTKQSKVTTLPASSNINGKGVGPIIEIRVGVYKFV
ncbi:MAG: hypothetical protein OC189_09565 [Acinetobacter sp.]|jgi:hypothetical protein|nr:hypothetical protein [Acinetobacter sp.]MDK4792273.1 hypothetical protein [Acinetobacter sp.]MDK4792274.1 hypothetical protein [Acinetobacter sp.]